MTTPLLVELVDGAGKGVGVKGDAVADGSEVGERDARIGNRGCPEDRHLEGQTLGVLGILVVLGVNAESYYAKE